MSAVAVATGRSAPAPAPSPRTPTASAVGLGPIAYAFPRHARTVRELAESGLLSSDPTLLEGFGFGRVRVAVEESPYELALRAARAVLERSGAAPASVGALLWGGPQGATAFVAVPSAAESSASHRTTGRFRYPGARLQHELGLARAQVFGVEQLACTTLFGAVRLARALCTAEGLERVLCVASEFFPADAGREALYNCTSDAAVALLVEAGGERNRIRGVAHVTKGYYWDADAHPNEMIAAYFPTAAHAIGQALDAAGWAPGEVDWVIPHNVSWRSWQVLLPLAGLGAARVWSENIARDGHTLAGDNFINLADALSTGAVRPGQKLLLFTFGYGAHWSALAVEA